MCRALLLLCLVLVGCPAEDPGVCAEANDALGGEACVHAVPDGAAWEGVAPSSGLADQVRATKYLVPARGDARLPTLFLNAHTVQLHHDLLAEGFADRFPALSPADYLALILPVDGREFHAGTVTEYIDGDAAFYGFTVWDDPEVAPGIDVAQVEAAHAGLSAAWGLDPLVFVPSSARQSADAAGWQTDVPIRAAPAVAYEPYTQATGYGTVRLLDREALSAAVADASIGVQDLLVLAEAPIDVERVVSGVVTATRQGELSHLNLRSAARGTPNCFLADAMTELAEWEGTLVALTCGATALVIEPATLADAEAWWDALRPDPVDVPAPDFGPLVPVPLLSVPTGDANERAAAVATYGAKAAGLATLYQRVDPAIRFDGFALPVALWQQFMEQGSWTADFGAGDETVSFAETIDRWLDDPAFLADAAVRRERLEALDVAMQVAPVDGAVLDTVGAAIEQAWGTDAVMVRFRSSSNAEDSVLFSGAGLYESTSVCLADDRDADEDGPSVCDPDQPDERGVARGLKRVWRSLWSMRAYEERDWFGIDPRAVAMGILVNDRAKDEQASVVAFSGNPFDAEDNRYVINAQAGEASVVAPASGEITEKVLLTVEGGSVTQILRVRDSNLVPPGTAVLSDALLESLGAHLAGMVDAYPLDGATGDVLLDTEWKVLADGRLVAKQIRPFLR